MQASKGEPLRLLARNRWFRLLPQNHEQEATMRIEFATVNASALR